MLLKDPRRRILLRNHDEMQYLALIVNSRSFRDEISQAPEMGRVAMMYGDRQHDWRPLHNEENVARQPVQAQTKKGSPSSCLLGPMPAELCQQVDKHLAFTLRV